MRGPRASEFDDGSIDVIISSDVFEHIIDVDTAHAQAARVLAEGGIHVWTAPQYRDLEISRPRVRRTPVGLEFLEPADYHDDPANPGRALVTFDWGRDLPERVEAPSGMWTTVFRLESRTHGLLGEFLEVFVSHRGHQDAVGPGARKSAETYVTGLEQANAELRACRDALGAVLSSRSWQATKPIRAISESIRRGLRGGRR